MTINHNYYLDLAFQLAEINLGRTGLNPSVGCVIVKNDTVLSTGKTSLSGRPHSEHNALHNLKNCSGATLYTTLEPCSHYGKTPPCVNIIIKKKIKKVFYAFEDPDSRSFKKAKKILTNKGINTQKLKTKKYKNFYKSYFLNKLSNTPFVTAKIAISGDYMTINKKNRWITNANSRKIVHLLRSKSDCILSTSKTINFDNPLLNCRIENLDNNKPDLFIVDLNLKLKKKLLLNNLLNKRKTFLITKNDNINKINTYKKKGYRIVLINSLDKKKDFKILYEKIYRLGYSRIMVEAGLTFLNSLLNNKMINDLYIFKSNMKLSKNGKNNSTAKYLKKYLTKRLTINLNGDKLYKKELK
tara:strand:+ start:5703 stop:6770 length:1068 start_codon:yes stop_codon:yes gene_type:complete